MDIGQIRDPFSKKNTDTGLFKIGDYDEGKGPATAKEPTLTEQISDALKETKKEVSDKLPERKQ